MARYKYYNYDQLMMVPVRTKGDGVEFRRFFFHLSVVMKSHATSSQNRCARCFASYHMQGYRATKHF